MASVDVVTGASSGVGKALVRAIAATGQPVLGVARRRGELETAGDGYQHFEAVVADVATETGRSAVRDSVGERRVRYLIHNAGRLDPVGDLATVNLEEWRASFAVNVEAPLFLTQTLLPVFDDGARILHISSGAAHRPRRGWGAYCASKATLSMVHRLLAEELAERGIGVGSVRPGVVDTPMQAHIREQSADRFPEVERFRRLKRDGELVSVEQVAWFILRVLTETTTERFTCPEWDIREHAEQFK